MSIITPNTITVVIITAHKWAPKAPGWGWWGLHLGPSTSRCDKAASAASASQISAQILQKSGGFEQNYPFIYPKLAEKALPKAELKGWGDTWALRSREHPSSLSAPFPGGRKRRERQEMLWWRASTRQLVVLHAVHRSPHRDSVDRSHYIP